MSLQARGNLDLKPSNLRPGILAGLFNAQGDGLNQSRMNEVQTAFDTANRTQENQVIRERYALFDKGLDESYTSRGMGDDLKRMSPETRKGLVHAASHVYAIHEVAQEAKEDVRAYGAKAIRDMHKQVDASLYEILNPKARALNVNKHSDNFIPRAWE